VVTAVSDNPALVPDANVVLGGTGSARTLSVTPVANQSGTAQITVTVTDADGSDPQQAVDSFELTVTAVDDLPVADDQEVLADKDTAVTVTLTGSDVDGDNLIFSVESGPVNGTLSGALPDLTYTPNADFTGSDSFTFKVSDGTAGSAEATVTILIGQITIAWNPSFSPAVVGYEVYYCKKSEENDPPEDYCNPNDYGLPKGSVGKTETDYVIWGLEGNQLYIIAVKAYDSNGFRSNFEEIEYKKSYPDDPGKITGTVKKLSDQGIEEPVSNLPVCAIESNSEFWAGCARTQIAGLYEIGNLPAGSYIVRAVAEELKLLGQYYPDVADPSAAEMINIVAGETMAGIDFVLRQGAVVEGKVVDFEDEQKPIETALVYAEESETEHVYEGITLSDGSYTVSGLPSGSYRVRAETLDSGYNREYYRNTYDYDSSEVVELSMEQSASNINFNLSEGGSISGTVIRQSEDPELDNQPIKELWVNAYDEENKKWVGNGRTGADGDYTITGLPTGNYYVRVETGNTDYPDEYYGDAYDRSSAVAVAVIAGQATENIDFSLVAGGTISGLVVAVSEQQPVAGLRVDVYDFETGRWWANAETQTDGVFIIKRLPAGEYRVRVETYDTEFLDTYNGGAADYSSVAPVQVNFEEVTTDINFSLITGGKISGKVTRASDGESLSDYWVVAYEHSTGSDVEYAQTGSEGTYSILRLPTGSYGVRVETGDTVYLKQYYEGTYDPDTARAIAVTVQEETADIDFSLVKGGSITGVVKRESDDQPLHNLWVSASNIDSGEWKGAQTEADGSYIIHQLQSGNYRVRADNDYNHNVYGEYFDDTYHDSLATWIAVVAPETYSGIDFLLTELSVIDSDWDRLTDSDEINIYQTDPYHADTDNDGIDDVDELEFWGSDWNKDFDNDGLSNLLDYDSDGDGLSDGYEDGQGSDPTIPDSVPAGVIAGTVFDSSAANDNLFRVFDLAGEMVIGTTSTESNIHSHYLGTEFDALTGILYSGRMLISDDTGGIGVTFLSQYPVADTYYRLSRYGSDAFQLAVHPNSYVVSGDTHTDVVPALDTWYLFKIEVQDTGSRTEFRAKVWSEGAAEPADWQIDAYDDKPTRLTSGKIGVWSATSDSKYWDDLAVETVDSSTSLYASDFENYSVGSIPADWINTGPGNSLEIEADGDIPLTRVEIFVELYTGDPCNNPQFIERVGINTTTGTYLFENLDPADGSYYLMSDNRGADYLNEWWSTSRSSPFCQDANPIDISAGGRGRIDFLLDGDEYPITRDDSALTVEDTVSAPIHVIGNDTDPDGSIDQGTVTIGMPPAHGMVAADTGGNIIYTPDLNFNGTDFFTYTVRDNQGAISEEATVTVIVESVNDKPAAYNQSLDYSVSEGEQQMVEAPGLLANYSDPEGDSLAAILLRDTVNGSLSLNPDGSFSYSHDGGENTGDSFSYQVTDGTALSDITDVTIQVTSVNDLPLARNDAYGLDQGGTIAIDAAAGLLANDADVDGDLLVAEIVSSPSFAAAFTLNADGSFSYAHDGSASASDGFSYRVSDGTAFSNVALVSIIVGSGNSAPTANNNTYNNVDEGGTLIVDASVGVRVDDVDTEQSNEELSVLLVSDVLHGKLTLNADGSFSYTHDGSENTEDSFTYQVSDGTLLSNISTVTIEIRPINDAPIPRDDAYSMTEDTVLSVEAPGVLVNDHDLDLPADDILEAVEVVAVSNGTLVLNADGSFTYNSENDFTGVAWFTYKAYDGQAYSEDAATVTITVDNRNDAPVITAQSLLSTAEDTVLNITLADLSVTDPDNTYPSGFSMTVGYGDNFSRMFNSIAPNPDFNGTLIVPVRVDDGEDANSTSTVFDLSVTVTAVNDAPTISGTPAVTALEDEAYSFEPYVADGDLPYSDILTFIVSNLPPWASFDTATGRLSGIPTNEDVGTITEIIISVLDSNLASDSLAPFDLEVINVNDPPVALDDTASTSEGVPIIIEILVNDSDEDGDGLTVTGVIMSTEPNGTVTLNSDNTIIYTPDAGFNGQETFTYEISDGRGGSDMATVGVHVYAGQFTLSWNSSESPEVAGYYVHVGTAPRDYTQTIDVGDVNSYNAWLAEKFVTYYFSVTAYDSEEQELEFFKPEISARVADSNHIETATNYEDAWNPIVRGWTVYDNDPAEATIVNVYDSDRGSRVIELSGAGTSNGYKLQDNDGNPLLNSYQFVVEWSMQYSENFEVNLDVNTTGGQLYIQYTPVDYSNLGNGEYVHHGLGSGVIDGKWHTFVRDLQADLEAAHPGESIIEVNGFRIRGSGRVDDIKLLSDIPASWDSDGDGLPDTIELISGSNLYDADTDDDGLVDGNAGSEDLNVNGILDPGETDPLNPDTDGDGIYDGTEKGLTQPETEDTDLSVGFFIPDADSNSTTDPTDGDSDEDGILDGNEDKNRDGMIELAAGETDPNNPDTDDDGIFDGTEIGLAEPQDPAATDLAQGNFIANADPLTTTNPTDNDSDSDGVYDGVEDHNRNGRVDAVETDPLNILSYPAAFIHLNKGLNLVSIPTYVAELPNLNDWLPILGNSTEVEKIMAHNDSTGAFVSLIPGDTSNENFVLKGHEGLLVYAKKSRSLGISTVTCSDLDLKAGINLVGIACPPDQYSAYQLLSDLGFDSVESIQRYSTETGAFESAGYSGAGETVGIDFSIISGEGYFIFMKQEVEDFSF